VYWPEADFDVGESVVRSLVREQFPDLGDRALRHVADGFDNALWRLGDDLLVRLARRHAGVALLANEVRWLPELAPRLPIATSVPLRVGRPSDEYPSLWVITIWFDGETLDNATLKSPDHAARSLGRFLRALHQRAPSDAPVNHVRGVALAARADAFEERLASLGGLVDAPSLRRVWDAAIAAAPWSLPPVWIHGDLHPVNLIATDGELGAVVDFGDVCAGDPATDLAGAWTLLPEESIDLLLETYGDRDADLIARALGWAVLFGLFFLEIGRGDRPTYRAVGLATLRRAVASHSLR
jgi:aminoglycoside phosphotransferase (APT) family kinase protein